jgi:hypothetical protein
MGQMSDTGQSPGRFPLPWALRPREGLESTLVILSEGLESRNVFFGVKRRIL